MKTCTQFIFELEGEHKSSCDLRLKVDISLIDTGVKKGNKSSVYIWEKPRRWSGCEDKSTQV